MHILQRMLHQVAEGGAVDAYNKCWAKSEMSSVDSGKAPRAIEYKRATWW